MSNESEPEIVDYSVFITEKDIYKENGDEYVYVNSLVRVAKQHAEMQGWDTEIIQAPIPETNWAATVKVRVQFRNGDFATGAADCRAETAAAGFELYTTALAETRALGRALRRYLQINLCTYEEKGDDDKQIADVQIKLLETKYKEFDLKDVSSIIGRDISSLKDLRQKEAADLIQTLSKLTGKKMKE